MRSRARLNRLMDSLRGDTKTLGQRLIELEERNALLEDRLRHLYRSLRMADPTAATLIGDGFPRSVLHDEESELNRGAPSTRENAVDRLGVPGTPIPDVLPGHRRCSLSSPFRTEPVPRKGVGPDLPDATPGKALYDAYQATEGAPRPETESYPTMGRRPDSSLEARRKKGRR